METLDDETSVQKRRRSRWDPPTSCSSNSSDTGLKRRKSRWDNDPPPNPATHLPKGIIEFDPELQVLNARPIAINHKLKSSKLLDDRPIDARSPSPEPVYDNLGIRINTREFRARDKLNCERQHIISMIVTKKPEFKPPGGECKKHFKKIYVPLKEYPGYNFVGLIIGPRGNTQKRMEKETGARISLRGKGSSKRDSSSNEELHVVVEADSRESVQAAAVMVEELLKPVDDMFNVHKREQLKELAKLNGTLDNRVKCGVSCEICGDSKHSTACCPLKKKTDDMDDVHQKFLAEMGGTVSESWWLGGPESSSNVSQGGSGSTVVPKGYDETNLYVGYLPLTVNDDGLAGLFLSFGEIVVSKVIKDVANGVSKGYGFVKFANVQQANIAIATMNGYALDGKTIAVRVAGKPPQPTLAKLPNVPVLLPPCTGLSQPGGTFTYPPAAHFGVQYPPQPTIAPVPNAPVLPPSIGLDQPGGTFTYPPAAHFGVQYPPQPTIAPVPNTHFGVQHPQLVPPSNFMPELVSSSTHNRYDFASFDEMPSYSSRQSESSTSVPVYTNVNSVTSKSATPYTYVLSNGAILPPLSALQSTMSRSRSPSNVPWATNSPMPLPSVSAEKSKFRSEAEYEKFMASMKWADF